MSYKTKYLYWNNSKLDQYCFCIEGSVQETYFLQYILNFVNMKTKQKIWKGASLKYIYI